MQKWQICIIMLGNVTNSLYFGRGLGLLPEPAAHLCAFKQLHRRHSRQHWAPSQPFEIERAIQQFHGVACILRYAWGVQSVQMPDPMDPQKYNIPLIRIFYFSSNYWMQRQELSGNWLDDLNVLQATLAWRLSWQPQLWYLQFLPPCLPCPALKPWMSPAATSQNLCLKLHQVSICQSVLFCPAVLTCFHILHHPVQFFALLVCITPEGSLPSFHAFANSWGKVRILVHIL